MSNFIYDWAGRRLSLQVALQSDPGTHKRSISFVHAHAYGQGHGSQSTREEPSDCRRERERIEGRASPRPILFVVVNNPGVDRHLNSISDHGALTSRHAAGAKEFLSLFIDHLKEMFTIGSR